MATVEQVARDIRDDIGAWTREQERTRLRLHEVEATVRGLTLAAKLVEESTQRRQRSLEIRVQLLTLVVGVGALVSPLLVYLLGR